MPAPVLRRVRRGAPGSRVRIAAPSSPHPIDKLTAGARRLADAGLAVDDAGDVLRGRHAYLNGTDEERATDVVDAINSDAEIVWLARGGYGLTRLLPALPALKDHGELPIVVGFSDATALSCWLLARGVPSVHGPLATTVAAEPELSFDHLLAVLDKRAAGRRIEGLRAVAHGGAAEGFLAGGNLCVLAALAGTGALPSFDGAILIVEEVGERPYRIDRMLTQLLQAGALRGVRAVVVGHLTGCDEPASTATASAARDPAPAPIDVFAERLAPLGVPVFAGLPIGHQAPNYALPIGCMARVDESALTLLQDLP